MQKNDSQSVHVIDNSVREQMRVFDRYGDNYFSDTISLIMNFEPYFIGLFWVAQPVPLSIASYLCVKVRQPSMFPTTTIP